MFVSTSEEMSAQALNLQEVVAYFKIGEILHSGKASRQRKPSAFDGGSKAAKVKPAIQMGSPDESDFARF